MSKTAILRVSDEFLREALHLPEGTVIEDARKCFDSSTLELRISHDDLREIPIGHVLPLVNAEMESVETEAPGREIRFRRWVE